MLCGQLTGAGVGVVLSASLAGWSWRAPFLVLAVPGLVLAFAVRRLLPEPERGSQGAIGDRPLDDALTAAIRDRDIRPRPHLVRPDLARLDVVRAVRYVLSVPSTAVLVVSSALAYFFLSGLETFMLEFHPGPFRRRPEHRERAGAPHRGRRSGRGFDATLGGSDREPA